MGDIDRQLLVFGRLRFPTGGRTAWRAHRVDAGGWDDWPGPLGGSHLGETTVAEVLAACAAMTDDQGEVVVTEQGEAVNVCGFFLEPGTAAWSRDLAAVVRVASEAGAKGSVVLVQVDGGAAARIRVAPHRSTVEELDEEDATSLLENAGAIAARKSYAAALGAPLAARSPLRPQVAEGIHATIRDRVRVALGRVPDAELHRLALAQALVCTGPGKWTPAAQAFARAELARALYSSLDTEWAVESGFNLVAQADLATAKALAVEILRSRHDGPLAVVSCSVLRGSPAPDALAALLDYAAPNEGPWPRILQADVTTALGSSSAPDVGRLLRDRLTALEGQAQAAEGVLRVARALHDRSELDEATRARLFARFPGLLWLQPTRPAMRSGKKRAAAARSAKAPAPSARAAKAPAAKARTTKTRSRTP